MVTVTICMTSGVTEDVDVAVGVTFSLTGCVTNITDMISGMATWGQGTSEEIDSELIFTP